MNFIFLSGMRLLSIFRLRSLVNLDHSSIYVTTRDSLVEYNLPYNSPRVLTHVQS